MLIDRTCFQVLSFVGSKWSSFWVNHKSSSPSLPNWPLKSVGWPTFPSNLRPFQNVLHPKVGTQINKRETKIKQKIFIVSSFMLDWVKTEWSEIFFFEPERKNDFTTQHKTKTINKKFLLLCPLRLIMLRGYERGSLCFAQISRYVRLKEIQSLANISAHMKCLLFI